MCHTSQAVDTSKMEGVADSGATRHFLVPSSAYKNIQALSKPIPITIPNGDIIRATHSCKVYYPQLPLTVRRGLSVPKMKHHSLISIKQICQAGCTVQFTDTKCDLYYKGKHIICGLEHPKSKLWMLPLSTNDDNIYIKEKYQPVAPPTAQLWANMISPPPALTTKSVLIRYYHQCAFAPRKSTWMRAIENGNYTTWPDLRAEDVRKYLPESIATDKGHMKRERKNLRSTQPTKLEHADTFPKQEHIPPGTTDIMCAIYEKTKLQDKNYNDLTG